MKQLGKTKDNKHAEIMNYIVKNLRYTKGFPENSQSIEVESPYNYYGDRGFVDIVVYSKNTILKRDNITEKFFHYDSLTLWEIKTELNDIGELLRQINRAQKYFLKARQIIGKHKIDTQRTEVKSFLVFPNTPHNIKTFNENTELFCIPNLTVWCISNSWSWRCLVHEGQIWEEFLKRRISS